MTMLAAMFYGPMDIRIEAIGTPETWEQATAMARPGGLVNFFGGCPSGTQVALETRPLHYSELTLKERCFSLCSNPLRSGTRTNYQPAD